MGYFDHADSVNLIEATPETIGPVMVGLVHNTRHGWYVYALISGRWEPLDGKHIWKTRRGAVKAAYKHFPPGEWLPVTSDDAPVEAVNMR